MRILPFWALLLAAMALTPPQGAFAQELGDPVVLQSSNASGVPVHPADGDAAYVRWPNGSEAVVVEVGRWFRVQAVDGDAGWVTQRYIDVIADEDEEDEANEELAYVVGTWNLEHFKRGASRGFPESRSGGPTYPQAQRDLDRVAGIIRDELQAAILVLNEINGQNMGSTPSSVEMDDLLGALGSGWQYVISRDGGSQRVALLHDTARAKRGKCTDFPNNEGPRDFLGCQFTLLSSDGSRMNDLVVIGVHLKSGQGKNQLHDAEMKALENAFDAAFNGKPFSTRENDVVIAGDFNANLYDSREESFWWDFAGERDIDVLAPSDVSDYPPTRLANVPLRPRSVIDYVMASRVQGGIGDDLVRSTARVHDELLMAPFEDFRRKVSDHLPVTITLRVRPDDD